MCVLVGDGVALITVITIDGRGVRLVLARGGLFAATAGLAALLGRAVRDAEG